MRKKKKNSDYRLREESYVDVMLCWLYKKIKLKVYNFRLAVCSFFKVLGLA